MASHDELRAIALHEFATAGYSGTSLQRIAEVAGFSKSSVLYHFASKEALLEAAIAPAIERLGAIIDRMENSPLTVESRRAFIVEFVDFLLEHRLEVHLFINQGSSLEDVPVVDRANAFIRRLADFFSSTTSSTEDVMRFGIALGGAAYMLVSMQSLQYMRQDEQPRRGAESAPVEEIKGALVKILTELLAPVPVNQPSN